MSKRFATTTIEQPSEKYIPGTDPYLIQGSIRTTLQKRFETGDITIENIDDAVEQSKNVLGIKDITEENERDIVNFASTVINTQIKDVSYAKKITDRLELSKDATMELSKDATMKTVAVISQLRVHLSENIGKKVDDAAVYGIMTSAFSSALEILTDPKTTKQQILNLTLDIVFSQIKFDTFSKRGGDQIIEAYGLALRVVPNISSEIIKPNETCFKTIAECIVAIKNDEKMVENNSLLKKIFTQKMAQMVQKGESALQQLLQKKMPKITDEQIVLAITYAAQELFSYQHYREHDPLTIGGRRSEYIFGLPEEELFALAVNKIVYSDSEPSAEVNESAMDDGEPSTKVNAPPIEKIVQYLTPTEKKDGPKSKVELNDYPSQALSSQKMTHEILSDAKAPQIDTSEVSEAVYPNAFVVKDTDEALDEAVRDFNSMFEPISVKSPMGESASSMDESASSEPLIDSSEMQRGFALSQLPLDSSYSSEPPKGVFSISQGTSTIENELIKNDEQIYDASYKESQESQLMQIEPTHSYSIKSLFDNMPQKRRDGKRGDEGEDDEDDESDNGSQVGRPTDTQSTFIPNQGGEGLCFELAVIYIFCKMLFARFGPQKPPAFKREERAFLNARITINLSMDTSNLHDMLNGLDPESYVYQVTVVYVFLFMLGFSCAIEINGEDPNDGGFSCAAFLMLIDLIQNKMAKEPDLNGDQENFDANFTQFKTFHQKYIHRSAKKILWPHDYRAYKIILGWSKKLKQQYACFAIHGDESNGNLIRYNNDIVGNLKKDGDMFALGIFHGTLNLLMPFFDHVKNIETAKKERKKIERKCDNVISSLQSIADGYRRAMLGENPAAVYKTTYDNITQTIAKQTVTKDEMLKASDEKIKELEVEKEKLAIELFKLNAKNEPCNHVISVELRIRNGVRCYRFKNTWAGLYISPWFCEDVFKFMGIGNDKMWGFFNFTVVSCRLVDFINREDDNLRRCKRLYNSIVCDDNDLFKTTIETIDPRKIMKTPGCKEIINDSMRYAVGTNRMRMFRVLLQIFGELLNFEITGLSRKYFYWQIFSKTEYLAIFPARVLGPYVVFHHFIYGNERNATIIDPRDIDSWHAYAQNCIKTAIGDSDTIQEKFSVHLWLLQIYVINVFKPAFNEFDNAIIENPAGACRVNGDAIGKLRVIQKRRGVWKRIDASLRNRDGVHRAAISEIDQIISNIITDQRTKLGKGNVNLKKQIEELHHIWARVQELLESQRDRDIPLQNFDEYLRGLEVLISEIDRWVIPGSAPVEGMDSEESTQPIDRSSQSSLSSGLSIFGSPPGSPTGSQSSPPGSPTGSPIGSQIDSLPGSYGDEEDAQPDPLGNFYPSKGELDEYGNYLGGGLRRRKVFHKNKPTKKQNQNQKKHLQKNKITKPMKKLKNKQTKNKNNKVRHVSKRKRATRRAKITF